MSKRPQSSSDKSPRKRPEIDKELQESLVKNSFLINIPVSESEVEKSKKLIGQALFDALGTGDPLLQEAVERQKKLKDELKYEQEEKEVLEKKLESMLLQQVRVERTILELIQSLKVTTDELKNIQRSISVEALENERMIINQSLQLANTRLLNCFSINGSVYVTSKSHPLVLPTKKYPYRMHTYGNSLKIYKQNLESPLSKQPKSSKKKFN